MVIRFGPGNAFTVGGECSEYHAVAAAEGAVPWLPLDLG